jgi:RNA polymerase sigma factor (sigma-70 family)
LASSYEDKFQERDTELERLFALARTGDERAYQQFLTILSKLAFSYAMRRLRDEEMSEDFSQDFLMAIHLARDSYDSSRPIGPWIGAIISRRFIDLLRKKKVRMIVSSDSENIEKVIQQDDQAEKTDFVHIWNSMSEEKQELLNAILVRGEDVEDVAKRMDKSPGSLRVMLTRTVDSLRRKIES